MRLITVVCVGLTPLLMHPMSDEVLDSLIKKVPKQQKADRSLEDIAAGNIYRNAEGRIGLPTGMLYACLKEAGRQVQFKAKKMVSTAESTMLPDFLSLRGDFMILDNVTPENEKDCWVVDKRRGVGNTGVAVPIIRPSFAQWQFTIQIELDESKLDEGKIKELFRIAGSSQGLGSFRPNKKGHFGRFAVADWKSVEMAKAQEIRLLVPARQFAEAA